MSFMNYFGTKEIVLWSVLLCITIVYFVYLYKQGEKEKIKSRSKAMLLTFVALVVGFVVIEYFS